jgi:DNA-binding CsgD family transcriptional regulator
VVSGVGGPSREDAIANEFVSPPATLGAHPLIAAWDVTTATLRPRRISDVLSDHEWRNHPVQAAMLELGGSPRGGLVREVGGGIRAGHLFYVIGINRQGRDFSSREVALAQILIPVALQHALRVSPVRLGNRPVPGLSPRELLVLDLASRGYTASAIAREVGSSARTVGKHLERAYRKLGVNDRASAVRLVLELGLLPPAAAHTPAIPLTRALPRARAEVPIRG